MYNFPQVTPTKSSISHRKPVYGFGINDANYIVRPKIKGKYVTCPIYSIWADMLERCFSKRYHSKRPTYKSCTIDPEWAYFSNFRSWVLTQDWQGKSLDKDLLFTRNKEYGPKICIFVTNEINNLLVYNTVKRGCFPVGVSFHKPGEKYRAKCNASGKIKHLGLHGTPQQAHAAYLKFKSNHVHEVALQQTDPRLKQALIRISGEIARGEYYK